MIGTFWAFTPAIVAIVLALITKQVYVSLFTGIFVGAMMYAKGNPLAALQSLFEVMSDKVGGNAPIIVFLVILGIIVVLMQKSGGAMAYGNWAERKIRTKNGAMAASAGLGCLIFVDDYFNCLTVGSTMRPVTDKFKVSHAKLAYIIDSTAAPICIIAPISSWAAAVSDNFDNGILAFIQAIPFNLYAILTIIFVFTLCFFNFDFGKMRSNERIAEATGDLDAGETEGVISDDKDIIANPKGKVHHLIVPVVVLIVCCITGMLYTGGFPEKNIIKAFSGCDAGMSLAIGSTIALVIIGIYYIATKVVSFKEITESFTQGFKAMVPAILILTFAWTLSGIMGAGVSIEDVAGGDNPYLYVNYFVQTTLSEMKFLTAIMPAIFFILACGIAFATGTSWGTFGILVPISLELVSGAGTALIMMTVAATLGGAVFGDHVSPISDTTILSSTGANCNHIDHVRTQMPYAVLIAAISFVTYLIAGFCTALGSVLSCLIMWAIGISLFAGSIFVIKHIEKQREAKTK